MQQADIRLIIEGGPVTPGILRVLTDTDEHKLSEVWVRLEQLSQTIWLVRQGADGDWVDEGQIKKVLLATLGHIETTVTDIAAIAGGFARKEAA